VLGRPFKSRGQPSGNQDSSSLRLKTTRYSLRRALSLDSGDSCTHNPTSGKLKTGSLFQTLKPRRLTTAHKMHTGFATRTEYADCADRGISKLLITGHKEWFNSVPGHHISKQLAESRLALPVRSQSAIFRRDPLRFPATMMAKDLNSNCPSLSPLLSAAWLKIAASIAPAAAMRSSLG
jgi:hypothetical protein